ncbi:ATP-binding cassette domain-containing protein [Chloroflexia bacterium SDU3-3]|nr:ATP-binding cassette domain-containing protein [Chloroflexia bacterium SDU3-3]
MTYAIETAHLTRRFGRSTAVADLDLCVPYQSVYGFLGPNGAGKSTTIRMLLGLIRPHAGSVQIFGQPLGGDRTATLGQIGALVELPSLYPHLTGRENMDITRLLRGLPRAEVDRALEIVEMRPHADRRVRGYSLGMRQRLALALALLGGPRLLILDEPTNGLDPAGIHEIRTLIQRLPEQHGITVFISSHLLGEIEQVASHVGIIQQGRMLFQGALEDLRQRHTRTALIGAAQPERAAQLLRQAGYAPAARADGMLAVSSDTPIDMAAITRMLVRADLDVTHVSEQGFSLEAQFMQLTSATAGERI